MDIRGKNIPLRDEEGDNNPYSLSTLYYYLNTNY
jgi:hypothetical protein